MDPTDEERRQRLATAATIAVVGLSDKPERDSNEVARYLQQQGYRIIPVNPALTEVLGERSYPSVSAIPPEIRIDILDVFRRSEQVPPIVEEAIARGVGAIYLQIGVDHPGAAERARAHGIPVETNRCVMQDHRRLHIPPRTPSR